MTSNLQIEYLKNDFLPTQQRKNKITIRNLTQLQPIRGIFLLPNFTHSNSYIKLIIMTISFNKGIQMNCMDSQGFTIVVAINNFQFYGFPTTNYFQIGKKIYIKEPYVKQQQNLLIIQVDDSSDIELDEVKQSSEEYRKIGKELVSKEMYVDAWCLYDEALKYYPNDKETTTFLLNKGIMSMKLNLKEQYRQCMEKALQRDPNNEKIYFHLFKYEAIKMNNITKDKFDVLRKKIKECTKIKQESKELLMNFLAIEESFQTNCKIDWYNSIINENAGEYYSSKLKVQKCEKGRGVFTTQNLAPGQILVIENPLVSCPRTADQSDYGQVFSNYITRLFARSQQFRQRIYHFYPLSNYTFQENQRIGLTQIQIMLIIRWNAYSNAPSAKSVYTMQLPTDSGLYEQTCVINHECDANCSRAFIGKSVIVFANRQIKANSEIFLDYTSSTSYQDRVEQLKIWQINCNCLKCQEDVRELKGEIFARKSKDLQTIMQKYTLELINGRNPEKVWKEILSETKGMIDFGSILLINTFGYASQALIKDADQRLIKVLPMSMKQAKSLRMRNSSLPQLQHLINIPK